MSSTCSARNRIPYGQALAIVASDIELDHAIMEICLRATGTVNRLPISIYVVPANEYGRISVFT